MSKKLVVISIDALGASDLSGDLSHLPTLRKLLKKGTHIKGVTGIYPTLTYPSHTSIITGEYPLKHGIINNTKLQSQKTSPDWFWYYQAIKVPTLYDLAHQVGLTTAAFLWPVTAKSPITYNIAEIFPNRIWTNQVLISLQASSPWFLFDMNRRFGHLRQGIQQPYLDDFVTACAVDTLVSKKPDLSLIHLVDMDSQRHEHGVTSQEAQAALVRQDQRVKEIIESTKVAGTYDQTVFAILGDHYQIDVTKMIRLNYEFGLRGWQRTNKNQTTKSDWDVYAKSADGSTYIYCQESATVEPREIREVIARVEGIEKIYTTEEVIHQGGPANCTFMVEARAGYYFTDEAQGPVVESVLPSEIGSTNRYRAVHGYSPQKPDYATTIVYAGPGIKENYQIEQGQLVDEGPTFGAILELPPFPQTTAGKVVSEIFD